MAAVPYQDSGLCVMWWRIEGGVEGGKSWKNGKNGRILIRKTAKMLKISLEKWQKWANFAWKSGGLFWWGLIIKWLCLLDLIGEIEKLLFNMGAAWLV